MENIQLIKKFQTWEKNKDTDGLKKTVLEYNTGQLESVDVAYTQMDGTYPTKGWSANKTSTMLYYLLSGSAKIFLVNGTSYIIDKEDVFVLPPNTFYRICGKFEALMICSPAWKPEQSIKKD